MKQELLKQLVKEIESWEESQERQEDGYEYERSFAEMWRKLGQKVLQGSLGELPKSRNQKKE